MAVLEMFRIEMQNENNDIFNYSGKAHKIKRFTYIKML